MVKTTAHLGLALLAVTATPALAEVPADGAGLDGLYAGSYLCQDGEHGVALQLAFAPRDGGAGLRADGWLAFFPVLAGAGGEFGAVTGRFTVMGVATPAGELLLDAGDWERQPEGYGAANFRGTIAQRDDGLWQITGRPMVGAESEFCSDMIATHILP